jgi:glucitol operon activator protein
MAIWQLGLILLAIVWVLQAIGTWAQMRHYRTVMGNISRQWTDGHLGAGNSRSILGKGMILILIIGPDDVVRRLMLMEGRSVFARFKILEGFEGLRLAVLRDPVVAEDRPKLAARKGFRVALGQALEQIERARGRTGEAVAEVGAT